MAQRRMLQPTQKPGTRACVPSSEGEPLHPRAKQHPEGACLHPRRAPSDAPPPNPSNGCRAESEMGEWNRRKSTSSALPGEGQTGPLVPHGATQPPRAPHAGGQPSGPEPSLGSPAACVTSTAGMGLPPELTQERMSRERPLAVCLAPDGAPGH